MIAALGIGVIGTILVVVLDSTQHFTDAATLLDFGFRHPVTH